ncbi:MAG: cache domain-containing protein, partial [Chloroflexota bacterium]|nr:cache domain-containing protein [Chloroflexota bacterium]
MSTLPSKPKRSFINQTMTSTIILVFLVTVLPMAALASWYGISTAYDSLRQNTETNLATLARQVSNELERSLYHSYQDIQTLADKPIIKSVDTSPSEKLSELQTAQAFYDNLQEYYSVFTDITLIDPDGTVIASTGDGDVNIDWRSKNWAELGYILVSDPYHSQSLPGKVTMAFAAPVLDGNEEMIAVLIGQRGLETVWEITDDAILGETGYTMVIDGRNRVIALPEKEKVFTQFDIPDGVAQPTEDKVTLFNYDERGKEMLAACIALESGPHWYVLVSQSTDEAFSVVTDTLRQILIGVMTACILFAFISIILIRRAMRPVKALSIGAEKIGYGDLTYRVPVTGPLEIRRLTNEFNNMAANLQNAENLRTEQVFLRKLQAASLALASSLSTDEVLRIISNGILEILSSDTVWIMLADENNTYLETKYAIGPKKDQALSDDQTPTIFRINEKVALNGDECPLTKLFKGNDPLFIDDSSRLKELAKNDVQLSVLIAQLGITTLNLVPLNLPDRAIGIIIFGNTSERPLSDEEKRIALVFAHEATISLERARLHDHELENTTELRRLNDLKSRLLHVLSHELKTPLTSLKTSAKLLEESNIDEINAKTQERLIGSISRATERLIGVADDIYPIADALTGSMKIEPRDTDCNKI